MIPVAGEVKCACCGGIFPHGESLGGFLAYPFATFCLPCEGGCKTACKAHKGHDLRECRITGCARSGDE